MVDVMVTWPVPGTFAFAMGFVAAALSSMLTVRLAGLAMWAMWAADAKMIQNGILSGND